MPWPWWAGGLLGWAACKNEQTYFSWAVFRVVRVPWPNTRITRNNFGYRGLEPELRFGFFEFGFFEFGLGFFGFGFRVSGILPTHTPEAPVRNGVLERVDNVKRGRCGPKLTWDESVKRDLKDWNISKEIALHRSVWRLVINVPES